MYLDKVFIKHPNICTVLKEESVCVFPISRQKVIRN